MMNCQSAGSYPGSHAEARPATEVIIYPTGMHEPACDDCARYWINLRPAEAGLAPLSSYVDHYERAKSALNAQQVREDKARAARELQPVADLLQRAGVVAGGEAVGQFGEGDPVSGRLPLGPFVAVEPDLGRIREVGADLDERRAKALIPQIEVVAGHPPVGLGGGELRRRRGSVPLVSGPD